MSSLAVAELQDLGPTDDSFDMSAFVPTEYLSQYFMVVEEDEQRLVDWQATILAERIGTHLATRGLKRFGLHIDAGCGPTVHHMIALSPYSESIKVMDFLEGNVGEVQKWLAQGEDAHDWNHFTRAILRAEGIDQPDEAMVLAREQETRNKISVANEGADQPKGSGLFVPFDLKQPRPWTQKMAGTGDLVSSFYVADSCTDKLPEFNEMTKNAFSLVAPGGLFVSCYLGGCESYAVGDSVVKSVNLQEEDLTLALKRAGAEDIEIIRYETPENAPDGFDHIFVASAVKPLT